MVSVSCDIFDVDDEPKYSKICKDDQNFICNHYSVKCPVQSFINELQANMLSNRDLRTICIIGDQKESLSPSGRSYRQTHNVNPLNSFN